MFRKLALLPTICLTGLLLAACATSSQQIGQQIGPQTGPQPANPSQAATLVRDAAVTLRELRAASPHRELDHWLAGARAVVVLPGVYRAGFFYSLHGGSGVVVARRADGNWSSPAFLSMGGAGFGIQAGLERARVILVVLEDTALEQLLAGGPDFATNAMFDVVGVREHMGPDSRTRGKPIIAFTDGFGIMAGAALHLGALGQARGLNASYHGPELAEGEAVLGSGSAPGLEVFELWEALLPARP